MMAAETFDDLLVDETGWTANMVKDRLYARHHASSAQMPGAWTVIEEWRNIDLLAFSAWSSAERYARVGYEVKVSRSDLRAELLSPGKRAANVEWCNSFYFAVPKGLLTPEELAWEEPEWERKDWIGEPCPGYLDKQCYPRSGRSKKYFVQVPNPTTRPYWESLQSTIVCPTCKGKGAISESRVQREAPTCWIPRDVGLVIVDGRSSRLVKKAPRRKEVPALGPRELSQLVRWVSMRPDPRHGRRRGHAAMSSAADANQEEP